VTGTLPAANVVTGTSGAVIPLLNGANTYSGASTFSAAMTNSTAGAASVSPLLFTGAIESGGTGTTNFPHIFFQPTGTTAATTWGTAGTVYGANLASGSTANFLDFRLNGGSSVFAVGSGGVVTVTGQVNLAANDVISSAGAITVRAGASNALNLGSGGLVTQ
jgi:hypothetical protein